MLSSSKTESSKRMTRPPEFPTESTSIIWEKLNSSRRIGWFCTFFSIRATKVCASQVVLRSFFENWLRYIPYSSILWGSWDLSLRGLFDGLLASYWRDDSYSALGSESVHSFLLMGCLRFLYLWSFLKALEGKRLCVFYVFFLEYHYFYIFQYTYLRSCFPHQL